jgi:hypothetical protein
VKRDREFGRMKAKKVVFDAVDGGKRFSAIVNCSSNDRQSNSGRLGRDAARLIGCKYLESRSNVDRSQKRR